MNKKLLYKEIGLIDDDLIEEATDLENIRLRNRQQTRWISIAASIVLLIGVGVTTFFLHNGNLNVDVPKDINESSTVVEKGDNENATIDNSDFKGFEITAYTMKENKEKYLSANYINETSATVMEPNVKILLARYSPLMSSVPGLPFTFDLTDKSIEIDGISVRVDSGKLLMWDSQKDDAAVHDCGTECICSIGDTLYWSPLNEEENSIVSNATIIVTAINDDNEIGHQTINIIFDGENYFAAVGEFKSLT
jgi:hypothetical protein